MQWKEDDEGYILVNNNCAGRIENENVEIMFITRAYHQPIFFTPTEFISLKLLRKSEYIEKLLSPNKWHSPITLSKFPNSFYRIHDRHKLTATHVTYRVFLLIKRRDFLVYVEKLRTNDPFAELYFDFLLIDTYINHYPHQTRYISYIINLGERLSNIARLINDRTRQFRRSKEKVTITGLQY